MPDITPEIQQILENNESLSSVTDTVLLENREDLQAIIAQAKQELDKINTELFQRASRHEEREYTVGDKKVKIITRLDFSKVPYGVAKKYHALRWTVDSKVLKPLYDKHLAIPNVEESEYIKVI